MILSRFGWAMVALLVAVLVALAATVRVQVVPAGQGTQKAGPPLVSLRHATTSDDAVAQNLPTASATPAVSATSDAGATASAAMTPQPAAPVKPDDTLQMPVAGVKPGDLSDNYGDPRDGGARRHTGLDIMAPGGTAVLAAVPGTIEKLYFSKGGGGITLYERSQDGHWMYYYAHLGGYAPGLQEGQKVTAGQHIAYVGDTGNAGAGNYHLHFGVSYLQDGDGWWQGTPVDPYPLLAGTPDGR